MKCHLVGAVILLGFGTGDGAAQDFGRVLGQAARRHLDDAIRLPRRTIGPRDGGRAVPLGQSRRGDAAVAPDDGALTVEGGVIPYEKVAEARRRMMRVAEAERQRRFACEVGARRPPGRLPSEATDDCRRSADLGTTAIVDGIVAGVQQTVAAVPVSLDGLRTLRETEGRYRSALREPARNASTIVSDTVWPRIAPLIEQRRRVLETALRPQIIAAMNARDGGPAVIDSLFGWHDPRRHFTYALLYEDAALIGTIPKRPGGEKLFFERTADIAQSNRERTQSATFRAWTEPTSNEMGLAIMRIALNTGGEQLSTSIIRAGTGLDGLGVMRAMPKLAVYMKIYEVRKTGCQRVTPGYRCTYRAWVRAFDGEGGRSIVTAMMDSWQTGSESPPLLFVPTRSGWYAPENEAAVRRAQSQVIEQLSDTASRIADAGGGAVSVLSGAQGGSGPEPGEDSQAEQERKLRVEEADRRRR